MMSEASFHNQMDSGMFPTFQEEISHSPEEVEISYLVGMLTLREIVEIRLKELALGPIEAATAAGLERTFIRDIVEGKKKSVRSDKISGLAAALRLDASALSRNEIVRMDDHGGLRTMQSAVKGVPVLGKVAANWWSSVEDTDFVYDDQELIPSVGGYPIEWQFALIVDGNCLNKVAQHGDRLVCLDIIKSGADIRPNDLVIIERHRNNGQEVQRTAKRVRPSPSGFQLWPESTDPNHQEPLEITSDDPDEFRVIGKVLWILRVP